tara:strand:+ start:251 stop:487 length:237 start_codon:yes stop_codon:yes gene_type:complete
LNFLKKNYILLILLITAFFVQLMANKKIHQSKKLEEENLNNKRDKIENCIDIENKSKRTFYENLKLSEYCIDKFGTKK